MTQSTRNHHGTRNPRLQTSLKPLLDHHEPRPPPLEAFCISFFIFIYEPYTKESGFCSHFSNNAVSCAHPTYITGERKTPHLLKNPFWDAEPSLSPSTTPTTTPNHPAGAMLRRAFAISTLQIPQTSRYHFKHCFISRPTSQMPRRNTTPFHATIFLRSLALCFLLFPPCSDNRFILSASDNNDYRFSTLQKRKTQTSLASPTHHPIYIWPLKTTIFAQFSAWRKRPASSSCAPVGARPLKTKQT